MKSEGAAAFMKAASVSYKELGAQERQLLKEDRNTTICTVGDVKKEGTKLFSKIKLLVIFIL